MNRNIILTAMALTMAQAAQAQDVPWQVSERLHPIIYPFTISPKTANKQFNDVGGHMPLTEEYGYVIIQPSAYRQKEGHDGSLGIIVGHIPGDMYIACEVRCAYCLYADQKCNKMTPMKSTSPGKVLSMFECRKCGAQLASAMFTGNTGLDYKYEGTHIINQECYVVEPIYNDFGFLKELRITNPTFMIEHMENEDGESSVTVGEFR